MVIHTTPRAEATRLGVIVPLPQAYGSLHVHQVGFGGVYGVHNPHPRL